MGPVESTEVGGPGDYWGDEAALNEKMVGGRRRSRRPDRQTRPPGQHREQKRGAAETAEIANPADSLGKTAEFGAKAGARAAAEVAGPPNT